MIFDKFKLDKNYNELEKKALRLEAVLAYKANGKTLENFLNSHPDISLADIKRWVSDQNLQERKNNREHDVTARKMREGQECLSENPFVIETMLMLKKMIEKKDSSYKNLLLLQAHITSNKSDYLAQLMVRFLYENRIQLHKHLDFLNEKLERLQEESEEFEEYC